MIFQDQVYEEIMERVRVRYSALSAQEADKLLDQHTDAPYEGGCNKCWWKEPCLTAAVPAWYVVREKR